MDTRFDWESEFGEDWQDLKQTILQTLDPASEMQTATLHAFVTSTMNIVSERFPVSYTLGIYDASYRETLGVGHPHIVGRICGSFHPTSRRYGVGDRCH